ncbi:MAG: transposase [Bacteroidota bacterium]|nr:transposase [Bacteroidota bacterium]
MALKLHFSTDLPQEGKQIVRYYRSRFQIEFQYRDAKQHTGLTHCQAKSENKLDFHFNASLTAVNLAVWQMFSTFYQLQTKSNFSPGYRFTPHVIAGLTRNLYFSIHIKVLNRIFGPSYGYRLNLNQICLRLNLGQECSYASSIRPG